MPREEHLVRQVQWKNILNQYGCDVFLERRVDIRGARVIVDVYAQAEGKTWLIEIGDISDERKTALMQYYAEENPNVVFVHEPYGYDLTQEVLEWLGAYRNSEGYRRFKLSELIRKQTYEKKLRESERLKSVASMFFVFGLLFFFLCVSVPSLLVLMWFVLTFWGLAFVIYSMAISKIPSRSMLFQQQIEEELT